MIEKVVKKRNLKEFSEIKENLEYWLSKSIDERISAVEEIRKATHGTSARLQRVARVIKQPRS
jgi:hypothetical protein